MAKRKILSDDDVSNVVDVIKNIIDSSKSHLPGNAILLDKEVIHNKNYNLLFNVYKSISATTRKPSSIIQEEITQLYRQLSENRKNISNLLNQDK